MADKLGSVYVEVVVDNDKAKKDLKETTKHLDDTGVAAEKTNKMSGALKLGMLAAGAAAVSFGKDSVKAYFDSAQAHTKLVTNLKVLKTNTSENASELEKLAAQMQKVGVIEDDVVIAGMSQLATFKLQSETIEKLTPKIGDMIAQLKGHNATAEDTVAINNLIGKAMTGSTGALSKYGIIMDENQKKVMQTGTETERAAMMVEILSQNYGKVNEALGKTPQGKITQLKNAFGDLQESVGKALVDLALPVMDELSGKSGNLMGVLTQLVQTIGKVGGGFIKALLPVLDILTPLVPLLKGLSTVVGIIPPIFLQFAAGAALTSKALDKITLSSLRSKTQISASTLALGSYQHEHQAFWRTLLTTGDNIQNVGGHFRNLGSMVKTEAAEFSSNLTMMASKAKTMGGNIVNALGGPMGISLMAGFAVFQHVTGKMDDAERAAKSLKKEAKEVAKELRFNTISTDGLSHVAQILDSLTKKGGEAAKSIASLNEGFDKIGADNKSASGTLSGLSDTEMAKVINSKKSFNAEIKKLDKQFKDAEGDISYRLANTFSGGLYDATSTVGGDKIDRTRTNLKKIEKETRDTQQSILEGNLALAKSLGANDIAKIFQVQADKLKKGGDLDAAYINTIAATKELDAVQQGITKTAERTALGLGKNTAAVKGNSEAMAKGAELASELKTKIGEVLSKTMGRTVESALRQSTSAELDSFKEMFAMKLRQNEEAATAYALQVTDFLKLTEDQAVQVTQTLSDMVMNEAHSYSTLLQNAINGLVPLDAAMAESAEIKAGGPTTQVYKENLAFLREVNDQFFGDIKFLHAQGFDDFAAAAVAKGPQAFGATTRSVVEEIKAGNLSTINAFTNAQASIKTKTDEYNQIWSAEESLAKNKIWDFSPTIMINPKIDQPTKKFNLQALADGDIKATQMLSFNVQGLYKGGKAMANMPYIVGERGPELFVPNGTGQVIPADKTASMMSRSMAGNLTDNKSGNTYITVDMSKVMAVSRTQVREVGNTFIEAVNEGLIARGIAPIADNKIRSAS